MEYNTRHEQSLPREGEKYIFSFHPMSIDSGCFITGIRAMVIHRQLFEVRFMYICFGRTQAFVLAGQKKIGANMILAWQATKKQSVEIHSCIVGYLHPTP